METSRCKLWINSKTQRELNHRDKIWLNHKLATNKVRIMIDYNNHSLDKNRMKLNRKSWWLIREHKNQKSMKFKKNKLFNRNQKMHIHWFKSSKEQSKQNSLKTNLSIKRTFWSSWIVMKYMRSWWRFFRKEKFYTVKWSKKRKAMVT